MIGGLNASTSGDPSFEFPQLCSYLQFMKQIAGKAASSKSVVKSHVYRPCNDSPMSLSMVFLGFEGIIPFVVLHDFLYNNGSSCLFWLVWNSLVFRTCISNLKYLLKAVFAPYHFLFSILGIYRQMIPHPLCTLTLICLPGYYSALSDSDGPP